MTGIPSPDSLVEVGHIQSAYGIKGWVWIFANTDPLTNIFDYSPWYACQGGVWREVRVLEWREQGKGLVASLEGVQDRNASEAIKGLKLWASRSHLPKLEAGDYYWSDLLDLQVFLEDGRLLGQVHSMMETGSNDVLVVRAVAGAMDGRERLVPWLPEQVVKQVDLTARRIVVDWDPDF